MRGKGTTGEAEKKVTGAPVIGELRRDGERGDMVEREGLSCPDRRGKGQKGWKYEAPTSAHLISFSGEERRATGAQREKETRTLL